MTVTAFQQANQLLREGKLEEAIAAYQSAIRQNSDFYLAHQNLGETLEKLGRWQEAVEAYQRAVELKPDAAWSLWALSRALQQVGRLEEAKKAGEQAVAIDPRLAKLNKSLENWSKETQQFQKQGSISTLSLPEKYHPKIDCIANEQKLLESNVLGYDAFWQYPAITEKHAYDMAKKYLQGYDQSIVYFGFPWATLIDQFLHKPENTKHLLLELEKYKPYLKQFRKVVTVCQHVHLLKYQYLFGELGITDIFWSHAIKNQPTLPEFQKISIHPFPLFPVQATDGSPQQLTGIFRKFLFCFVGAKSQSFYLSDSRNQIIKHLSSDKRGVIRSRETWHYQKIVYEYQIKQNILDDKDLVDQSPTSEFKEILKQSVFSLCPSGSGPNSIRLWESIGYGSIPVVLSDTYLPPGDLDLWESAVVVCPEQSDEIKALPERLLRLNQDQSLLRQKQSALQELWERYGVDCFIYDIVRFFKSRFSEYLSSHRNHDRIMFPVLMLPKFIPKF